MARIRSIKPDFWTDTLIVQLPHVTRLLYIALWNVADDHGYLLDEPERIAMEVMPREPAGIVDASVQLLAAAGRLEWFVDDDGRSYYRVAKWEDHQRVDHPAKSKIFRESSRKLAIPLSARRAVAEKYGCQPGEVKDAACFYCGAPGSVHWWKLADGRPSGWVVFPGLELDHLESEAAGGETSKENIVLACRACNRGKGKKHWLDFFSSQFFASPRETARSLAPEVEGKGKERKGTKPSSPKGSRLPADWRLSTEQIEWAIGAQPSWDAEHALLIGEGFRDYWTARPGKESYKLDWEATWRTWVRRSDPKRGGKPAQTDTGYL